MEYLREPKSNVRCTTILIHSVRPMNANEVTTQLFDHRDSSNITGTSRHIGGHAVRFASTVIMIGVLARNPTHAVRINHRGIQTVPDLSQRWMRLQEISTILDAAKLKQPVITPGRQALEILSKIIYIQDDRKLSRTSSAEVEEVTMKLFMPEDSEKIVHIGFVDQTRWIVHFKTPDIVLDILSRYGAAKAKTKGVRMDRFWYHGLQDKLRRSTSHRTKRYAESSALTPESNMSQCGIDKGEQCMTMRADFTSSRHRS